MVGAPRKGRSNGIFRCQDKGFTSVLGREGRKRKVNVKMERKGHQKRKLFLLWYLSTLYSQLAENDE